mgnify:CR=1 FL=1
MTSDYVQAKKKPQLSAKKISIQVGSKKKLKVKNTKKKVIWTIKSGKKNVSLLSKKKTSVTIAGKKAGEAKIQAKAAGKKLICKVTVTKKASSQTGTPTTEPGATAENSAVIPPVNPGVNSTDSPKETAKADPTQKETAGATPAITPGVNSTDSPKETAKANPTPKETAGATPTVSPKATTTPVPSKYGLNNPTYINGVTTWDCVYFGNYLQYDTNGDEKVDENDEKQPIMWRVLSVDGDDAFLLADQCLDKKYYYDPIYDEDEQIINKEDVTWETCSLRAWLNDSFLKKAFSEQEQKAIIRTTVVNEDNMEYYDPEEECYDIGKGGNDTNDLVYLLSISEAKNEKYGLRGVNNSLRAIGTQYAGFDNSWWLRSPGFDNRSAAVVDSIINDDGHFVSEVESVRPVLHLDLSSGLWKKAPKISGTGDELKIDPVSDYSPEKTEANDTYGLDNPSISNGVTTWDCVYFGNYWQEADGNKKQPVKWRVLSVKDNDAFLLADKCLDCQSYDQMYSWKKWESCSLRSWLNDTFLNNAFSEQEQEAIFDTTVVNECDPIFYTTGGADTVDKIYLLSESEIVNVAYGFNGDQGKHIKSRVSKATPYAVQKGVYVIPDDVVGDDEEWIGNAWWWLRSPGAEMNWSSAVNAAGAKGVGEGGAGEYADKDYGVRPVLHLNLSSDLWKHAGKVTSNDE